MTESKPVTVVIPCRKIDDLTLICLKKIKEYDPSTPIIVVADELTELSFNGIQLVKSTTPNLSEKRNLAVSLAQSKYIAFIDSDAYPDKDWLRRGVENLERLKDAGVIGGPNLMHELCDDNQEIPYLAQQCLFVGREPKPKSDQIKVETVASSNLFFEKDKFLKIGGLDKNLYTGEDIELCYRFAKKYKNYFVKDLVVHHRRRRLKGFVKQRYIWGRGILNVYSKTFPAYSTSLIPPIFILFSVFLVYFSYKAFCIFASAYILFCFLNPYLISKSIKLSFCALPYVLLSIPIMGLGSIASIFLGDINNDYRNYDNTE